MVTTEVAVVGGALHRGAGSAVVSVTDTTGKGRVKIGGGEEVTGVVSSATEARTSVMILVAVSTAEVAGT